MAKRLTAKRVDELIEAAYRRRCSGIEINVLDIGKVFAAGRKAAMDLMEAVIVDAKPVPPATVLTARVEGAIEAAVVAAVEKLTGRAVPSPAGKIPASPSLPVVDADSREEREIDARMAEREGG